MTLIASVFGSGFVAISDVLLSSPHGTPRERPRVSLPLHAKPVGDEFGAVISGVAQKAILIGSKGLYMWAGSRVVAMSLLKDIRNICSRGLPVDIYSIIDNSGMTPAEVNSVSIIYHEIVGDDLRRTGHNIKNTKTGKYNIFHAGSGEFDFFDSSGVNLAGQVFSDGGLLAEFIMRLAHTLVSEAHGGHPLRFAYGGWHEITGVQSGEFIKIPYLLKFWKLEGDGIADYPGLLSWYEDDDLYVLRYDYSKCAEERLFLNLISSPMSDGARQLPPVVVPKQEPALQIHAVYLDHNKYKMVIRWGVWEEYRIIAQNGSIDILYSQEFIEELFRAIDGSGRLGFIERPYDVPPSA